MTRKTMVNYESYRDSCLHRPLCRHSIYNLGALEARIEA
jgi:hypothetical protein